MKKILLSLAAAGAATGAANAQQLLNYGFEEGQTATIDTANWAAKSGSLYDLKAEDPINKGNKVLAVSTPDDANDWERVIAFKGLDIKENKSYRVTLKVAANAKMNVAILQGDWNRDIALQSAAGAQTATHTFSDENSYQTASFVFWSPTFETMKEKYGAKADTLTKEYFLRLAFTGTGNYFVDDVVVEESSIKGIRFNGDAILVDFGYANNAAALASANGGHLALDPSCVKVVVDGEEVTPEFVECKVEGFCIFLPEAILTEDSKVSVSFTNPGDLKYTTNIAPFCFETPNAAVCNFENEAGSFDETLELSSFAWEEAKLVSTTPDDNSFEWEGNEIKQFSLTYDKNITKENASAVLKGSSIEEKLILVGVEGQTITFKRADDAAPLANGSYDVIVSGITNEKGVERGETNLITFEVGKIQVRETKYTTIAENIMEGLVDGTVPEGWAINNEGEIRSHVGGSYGSGPRGFAFSSSNVKGALYFRTAFTDGENKTIGEVSYGDSIGHELTLPAGDIEFRALVAAWKNPGYQLTIKLLDADTKEVAAEKTINVEANANGNKSGNFDKVPLRLKSDGGNYIYKVSITDGSAQHEALCGGYEVCTYVETQGVPTEPEIVFEEKFGSSANNAAPAAGSGWKIYAGGNAKNPGQDYNYNGARMFDLGYKNLTKGFYNGMAGAKDTDYLIYGQGGVTTLEDGTEVEEPTLKFDGGKVQFTYYCTNWKTDSQRQTLDVLDMDGNVVYSRTDEIKPNPGGDRNASIEAQKVQFTQFFDAGQYMLKFYTDGEGFVGNLTIETVSSPAIQWKHMLNLALEPAREELALAMAEDKYDGKTRVALDAAIKDYSNPSLHSPKEYEAAIAELENLVRTSAARRANIDGYAESLEKLTTLISDNAETKYVGLEQYPTAQKLVETYKEVDCTKLEDEELNSAVKGFKDSYALLDNMIKQCVGLLTEQITTLAEQIVKMDETQADSEVILAAGNALTDDQALVRVLKLKLTETIYTKIAAGEKLFEVTDEEVGITTPESLNLTGMIQNANFYTDAIKQKDGAKANEKSFPGWDIEIKQNSILADWGWGGPYNASETCPISQAAVCTAWGTSEVYVKQDIADIPVGIYTLKIGVGDGTKKEDESLSYGFAKSGEQADTIIVANDGGARALVACEMMNIKVNAAEGANTGVATLGGALKSRGDFSKIDEAEMYLTGALDGFDYAAAAAAIRKEIEDALNIEAIAEGEAVVTYYNLNGQKIAAAEGICIKVERYSNGYVVVKKVVVK